MISVCLIWLRVCALYSVAGLLVLVSMSSVVSAEAHPLEKTPLPVDTTKTSWFALPVLYYTPETSLGGGFAGGYFFGSDPARISSINADISATLKGDYEAGADIDLYLNEGQYRLWSNINAELAPASFFGVGPTTRSAAVEEYTQRLFDMNLQTTRRFTFALYLGIRTRLYNSAITSVADGGLLDRQTVPGATGSTAVGVGPALVLDTRSRTYYPERGRYLSMYVQVHPTLSDAMYSFTRVVVDARQFVDVGNSQVLALQGYAEGVAGTPPFALMPKLGGSQRMRGYRHARFRDNVTVTAQAEWRMPVWWRIDAALFGSVGTIAPHVMALGRGGLKPAGGLGLRYRLNDAGVRLRADFAVSPDGTGLYLTGSPPF